MNLVQRFLSSSPSESRSMSVDDWAFLYGGHQYPLLNTTWTTGTEEEPSSFEELGAHWLRGNPVVFAATSIRLALFSQARLTWRRRIAGQVVDTFTDRGLQPLQRPWPGGTTSDLLGRMLMHADTAGNAFVWRSPAGRMHLLRPDRVTILLGSRLYDADPASAPDVEVAGYLYEPKNGGPPQTYMADEVAHFAPSPDPKALFRGMSWVTPVVREIRGDSAATAHKLKYFDNAATPNMVVKFDPSIAPERVDTFRQLFDDDHVGVDQAYKTLFLGGGADATVIGGDMRQMDFARTQGKGETRILMAAGIPPVVAGASEGLSGSSLNAGNYNAAKRALSDIRLQHLWVNAVSSLEMIVSPSSTSEANGSVELWFDKSEIPFLQDDLKDTAEIQQKQSQAIRSLTESGYEPTSVVAAIENDDMSQLRHTGVFSVQLQPPGNENGGAAEEGPEDE